MLQADETLDFHNKQIADVALGVRCKNSEKSCAYILTSPLGHVYTNACPDGLHCVKLYGDTSYDNIKWDTKVDFIRASNLMPSNKHAKQLKTWLQLYFSDPLKSEDVEISFCGLEEYGKFNSDVWMAIKRTCPPGELMSYRELGERSGYGPGASKVVGYAINKNPYMLVVGDHRVIKATGEIWCENDSQRNKLRRLLVHYEISFTSMSFDDALLKVKERNEQSKKPRNKTAKVKTESRARVKTESKDIVEADSTTTKGRGVKKETKKRVAATKKKTTRGRGRRRKDETSEEDSDRDEHLIDDDEE